MLKKKYTFTDIYDTIVFANRNIQNATIPKTIKFIDPCSFENCNQLKKVCIPDDSQLEIIGKLAFSNSSIVSFVVPKCVTKIGNAFDNCHNLKCVEVQCEYLSNDQIFDDCSQLMIISFPNVKILTFSTTLKQFQTNFSLFISAGVEINCN